MANLTIDEMKKVLTDNNVSVPAGRLKKEDYVKLLDGIVLNSSLSDTYASDDDNKDSQDSRRVTSTNENNSEMDVEQMSDELLYEKLRELGYDSGPVVPSTRKIYEKKYIKLLNGDNNGNSNGLDASLIVDPVEISDNEVDIPVPIERRHTPQPSTSRRETSREPSLPRSIRQSSREPSVSHVAPEREASVPVPRRVSYIEKIAKGSNMRIIEEPSVATSPLIRHRYNIDAAGDRYVGRWTPMTSTNKFLAPQPEVVNKVGLKKNYILIAAIILILLVAAAFAYTHWTTPDEYQQIEDGAIDTLALKEHPVRQEN